MKYSIRAPIGCLLDYPSARKVVQQKVKRTLNTRAEKAKSRKSLLTLELIVFIQQKHQANWQILLMFSLAQFKESLFADLLSIPENTN